MNITLNLVPLVAVRVRHRYRCMLEILQSSNHNTNWNHIPYWPYINLFHCSLFTYIVLTCLCTKAYTHIWSRWGPHPKQIVDTSTGWQTASSHHPDNMKHNHCESNQQNIIKVKSSIHCKTQAGLPTDSQSTSNFPLCLSQPAVLRGPCGVPSCELPVCSALLNIRFTPRITMPSTTL